MRAHKNLLAAFAAIGLVGAGAALHSGTPVAHATPAAAIPTDGSIADVAERVVDSVVNISVKQEVRNQNTGFFDPFSGDPFESDQGTRVVSGKGSGVIITATGRILTNAHVVDGMDDIKVTLQDGTELDAKVVGKDPQADLAVIQLKGNFPPLKPIAFGDSSALRLGDIVLAIGDGMGIGKSVSMGIVSAKGRSGMNIETYEDFIQTDAAINPGNSGGALVNLKGELVGINTAIASRSGGNQGIGFAIPTNMARPIMEMLIRDGKVSRGYLGVSIGTATPELAKQYKLGATRGAAIGEVEADGPAAKSGLRQGDVVVALNGTEVKTGDALRNTIGMMKPGTTVDLQVFHQDGRKATIKAKLGERPENLNAQRRQPQQQQFQRRYTWP